MAEQTINNAVYEELGDRWYEAKDDPIALLRAETKVRLPWALEELQKVFPNGGDILDIGCGGGFMSTGISQAGYKVTGVDMAADALETAKRADKEGKITYLQGNAHSLDFPDESFDAAFAMDFLEHTETPQIAVREAARVLKPGGLFFFHTFNRNILSKLVIIKLVERFVQNVPENLHVYELFIKPSELKAMCKDNGLESFQAIGLKPKFNKAFLRLIRTGLVEDDFEFELKSFTGMGYLGLARKKK